MRLLPPDPITIIIPALNAERTIIQALQSALTQTFAPYQVLIVDDQSTDRTSQIVRSFQERHPNLHLISGPGIGVSGAVNVGAKIVTSPLIARLDADDIAEPTRLERQAQAMQDHPDWALCSTYVSVIDTHGAPLGKILKSPLEPESIRHSLLKKNCLYQPSIIYRRCLIDAVGGYRIFYRRAQDYDLYLRLMETRKMGCIPEVLTRYRIHPTQATGDIAKTYKLYGDAALLCALARRRGCPEPHFTHENLAAQVQEVLRKELLHSDHCELSAWTSRRMITRQKNAGLEITGIKRLALKTILKRFELKEALKTALL
ncbi:glycosyltransferase family 2 protein [Flexibacterium corallicola]|uniref:glycosyltransferase family 2 protein n=1 Tax=Flexibacterium corallicola TaxID=3037259 RepID=UPI00286FAB1E|nr:glycosyltransferase [Pseudovibrio sp. M1P-2-3]